MPFLPPPPDNAPRAIIFDIGRVIIRVDISRWSGTLGPAGKSHLQILRELEADPRWADWQEGRMNPHDWHAHVCEKFQLPLDFEQFCAAWNSVLDPVTILPDHLFERLATKCRLALLSNTDPIHVAHIEAAFPFVRHFPARVYSCRIGSTKPSPVIFHHTLRELDALPEEAMFIDDIHEHAMAAAAIGMAGFHFTSAEDLLAEFSRLGLA
ncbi:MAG: HAD-IA family hydrolase [Acidobacteriia bacterium]|nr:HAD-IA family hydrolase [Terriglobia bacterium]